MDSDRLARLTERQRACLRHVYAHRTSKEIAPLLGIAPSSVDQHIKTAMRMLGVANRRVAARLVAEDEALPEPRLAMREEQRNYDPAPALRDPVLPLPLEGHGSAYVGWPKRLAWIAFIAIGIALAFGALIAGAEGLIRVVWGS